jgi:hypothetical protein
VRTANRVLAVAAALGLAAGGLLVAVEIAWSGLGHERWIIPYDDWYTDARTNRWDSSQARSLFLALTVAGVVVLALQLVRPRPRSIPLEEGQTRAGLTRRSLEKALARTAGSQDGVAKAKATIRRRRIRIRAVTRRTQGDLQPRVEKAARRCLHDLGIDGDLELAVQVRRQPK